MRKLLLSFCVSAFLMVNSVSAQEEDKVSIDLSLNHDAFFGFNPMLAGAVKAGSGEFTFYGIQWGAGTAIAWGNWTEFGLGWNFKAGEYLSINPQLGFTMGNLLSSFTTGKYAIGDGIVPNLTINLDSDKMEGQLYSGFYAALRKESPMTANYLHSWINVGGKVNSWFSVGGHVENLFRAGGSNQPTTTSQYYTWVGPYVQFTKGIAGLRLSGGANIAGDEAKANFNGDFYKMSMFFSF